jgi:hypothetical protein
LIRGADYSLAGGYELGWKHVVSKLAVHWNSNVTLLQQFFLIPVLVLALQLLKYNKQYCAGKLILPVSCGPVQYCSTQLGIGKAGLQRSREKEVRAADP